MRWFKPNIRSSIYSLLGPAFGLSQSAVEEKVEDIREAMLDLLGESGAKLFPQTTQRLRYAPGVIDLWHLRPNLMAALAAMHGEDEARLRTANITLMFDGLLPRALRSRGTPLGSSHTWRVASAPATGVRGDGASSEARPRVKKTG
jgi:hypothetical protein